MQKCKNYYTTLALPCCVVLLAVLIILTNVPIILLLSVHKEVNCSSLSASVL